MGAEQPQWWDPGPEQASRFSQEYFEQRIVPIPTPPFSIGRPTSLLLGTVADRRLRMRKAIPLGVSVEDGHVVVSWDDTNEFACGASTGDAIDEFSKTIAELFFDLNDQSIPLGKDLARVRDILNEHIEKVQIR
jgi:hypothetical protein